MKLRPIGSNMNEVEIGGATVLFSYQTAVAARVGGKFYRTSRHYSNTTSKHINKWLAGVHAETVPPEFFTQLTCGSCGV